MNEREHRMAALFTGRARRHMPEVMSASPVIVRPATATDQPALGKLGALLVKRHHEFDAQRFIPPTRDTESVYGAFLRSELNHADHLVLVAEEGGQVLGYAYGALEGSDWMMLRGPAGVIYDLAVDPDRRRAGVGRRLMEAMISGLQELGATRIVLFAAERNEIARRLFASAGFRPTMIEMTRELTEQ